MNYYPNNFYSNYPYGNTYPQQMQQQVQQPPQYNNNNNNTNILQGKIVDSEEMVKVTEVPFGGYGIFPKADFSEIYVKTWNNNGTTQINTFCPIVTQKKEEVDTQALILTKITELENKLDNFIGNKNNTTTSTATTSIEKKKELNMNAY